MEEAAMRLSARDQVKSQLENVSLVVFAIIPFSPEQVELHRHHLKPSTCLVVQI